MSHRSYLRRAFRLGRHRPDVRRDVANEIEFWIEQRVQELIQQGLSPQAARRSALRAFGDRPSIEAECRRITEPVERRRHGARRLESVIADLGYAVRGMRRDTVFTATAVLTLALCLAANTAIFSLVRGVLWRSLPYEESERIVRMFNTYPGIGVARSAGSVPEYFERREHAQGFEEVAGYVEQSHTIATGDRAARVMSMNVTPSFFTVLRTKPALGRVFTESEGEIGRHDVVVLGYGLWRRIFAGGDGALGATLKVNGTPYRVVGVMSKDFQWPGWSAELWIPLVFTDADRAEERRHSNNIELVARLARGVTIEQAQHQIDGLNESIRQSYSSEERATVDSTGFRTVVRVLREDLASEVRTPLLVLWGGALFLLLIGSVNVINLYLVRATRRQRELVVRQVLGAGRWRILRQLATEGIAMSLLGGGLGVVAGVWCLRLFERYELPRLSEVRLDSATVAAAAGFCVLLGAFVGLVPGWLQVRAEEGGGWRSGGLTTSVGRRVLNLRGALAALQVAAAFVLLAGAGLLAASLGNLLAVDSGFRTESLLAAALNVTPERLPDAVGRSQFLSSYLRQVRSLPGVVDAAVATSLPFSGLGSKGPVTVEGFERRPEEGLLVHHRDRVSPGYFRTMGIPIVSGRDFDAQDTLEQQLVVIVDQSFASRYWPDQNPLGHRLFLGLDAGPEPVWHTVVGVVGTVVHEDLSIGNPDGSLYSPHTQSGLTFVRLVVRTDDDPFAVVPLLRAELRELDPEMPLFWVTTMKDAVAATLADRRLPMQLLAGFAIVALFLAATGLYGVLAFSVGARVKEFGIRVALGCNRAKILRMVLGQALSVVATGLVIGVVAVAVLSRLVAALLYGVGPVDPMVLGLMAAVVMSVALLAALAPTHRATRVDPVVVLSQE